MSDEQLFLRSKVIVEPLVDRFVAQPHTIAPVQASMNLAFLHVPLLESYLQSPQVHVAASNNPELRGGYFINIPEERADEVRDLLGAIKRDRADMLKFAEAIAAGQEILRANATGFDLTRSTRSCRRSWAASSSWPTTWTTRHSCASWSR